MSLITAAAAQPATNTAKDTLNLYDLIKRRECTEYQPLLLLIQLMLRAKQMGRVPRNERGKKRGSQCFAGLPEVVKETGQQQRPQQSKLNQHLTLIASRFSPSLASSPVLSLSQLTTGNNKTHTHTRMALFFSDACNVSFFPFSFSTIFCLNPTLFWRPHFWIYI